jgi:peptidoglycan/xylan/chitin deacetylase (PgdA/CDA1 family)
VSDVIAIQRTPAGLASAMLALQRSAGNQAAVRTLARKTKKTVHLTFDDGPKRETTPMALDALDKEGIKATFYIQGNHVKGNEDILCDISQVAFRGVARSSVSRRPSGGEGGDHLLAVLDFFF